MADIDEKNCKTLCKANISSSSVMFEISGTLIKHLPTMIVAIYFYLLSLISYIFTSIEIIFLPLLK